MKFIPQALADEKSRQVLFVWHDQDEFNRNWRDKVKTVDAPGESIHPRLVVVGDFIDWYPTGWNKAVVKLIGFTPGSHDTPGYHRSGAYSFTTDSGIMTCRIDGLLNRDAPLYVFRDGAARVTQK